MDIYAAWFKNQIALWPKRIFSLGGSNKVFENAVPSGYGDFGQAKKNKKEFLKIVRAKEDPASFCKRGIFALIKALNESEFAENLKTELAPLLLTDEKEITESKLETAIKEAARG